MNKESQTVEYKQNWHNDNLKVVSAFANSGGGALFIGVRVQCSVFECDLNQARIEQLFKAAKKAINTKEDSLRIYPLCARCADKRMGSGIGLGELPGPVLLF